MELFFRTLLISESYEELLETYSYDWKSTESQLEIWSCHILKKEINYHGEITLQMRSGIWDVLVQKNVSSDEANAQFTKRGQRNKDRSFLENDHLLLSPN